MGLLPPPSRFQRETASINESLSQEKEPVMKPTGLSPSRATAPLVVSCDIGMQSIHVVCPALGASSFPRVYSIDNYTNPIRMELTALRDAARAAGHG